MTRDQRAPSRALTVEDVKERVPSIQFIDAYNVEKDVIELTANAPDYFWSVPASSSGYHHPLCRGRHGLWIHTLMLSTVIDRLADSYVQQGRLTEYDIDLAHAAAILHDQRKNGSPENPQDTSTSDHDLKMAAVIREQSGLPYVVADAVESHMGPWYDGPKPETDLDDLLHTADMIASTESITAAIPGPIPDELADLDIEVFNP